MLVSREPIIDTATYHKGQLKHNSCNMKELWVFAGEMHSTICVEWADDHFGVGLR